MATNVFHTARAELALAGAPRLPFSVVCPVCNAEEGAVCHGEGNAEPLPIPSVINHTIALFDPELWRVPVGSGDPT